MKEENKLSVTLLIIAIFIVVFMIINPLIIFGNDPKIAWITISVLISIALSMAILGLYRLIKEE